MKITLIGKPGCHLCDDALTTMKEIVSQTHIDVEWEVLSILEDDELKNKYSEEIPVIKINDQVHDIFRVDPERFRKALLLDIG
jgi:glutaredoxin